MLFGKKVTLINFTLKLVFIAQQVISSYQVDWVRKAVPEPVILQKLSQVRDVARGESKRVQFGQFGVRWYPGQAGF